MNERTTGHASEIVWVDELALDACWSYLETEPMGRVAFDLGGRPTILPVNHVVHGHSIVFRTEPSSPLGQLAVRQPVAFEVDAIAADRKTGWSVLVSGEIERLDEGAVARLSPARPEPWAPGARDLWLRVNPFSVTGRAIVRRQRQADGTFRPYMSPD